MKVEIQTAGKHGDERRIIHRCDFCAEYFDTEEELRRHLTKHSEEVDPNPDGLRRHEHK
jgi:hypothetical protein